MPLVHVSVPPLSILSDVKTKNYGHLSPISTSLRIYSTFYRRCNKNERSILADADQFRSLFELLHSLIEAFRVFI